MELPKTKEPHRADGKHRTNGAPEPRAFLNDPRLYKETFAACALAALRAEMADDFGPYHLLLEKTCSNSARVFFADVGRMREQ